MRHYDKVHGFSETLLERFQEFGAAAEEARGAMRDAGRVRKAREDEL